MGKELYVGILEREKEGLREHPFSSHKTSYGSPTPPIIFGAWAFPRLRILCKRFVVTPQLLACSLCAFLIFPSIYLFVQPSPRPPQSARSDSPSIMVTCVMQIPRLRIVCDRNFPFFFCPFSFSSIFAFFKYLIPIFNSKEESTTDWVNARCGLSDLTVRAPVSEYLQQHGISYTNRFYILMKIFIFIFGIRLFFLQKYLY